MERDASELQAVWAEVRFFLEDPRNNNKSAADLRTQSKEQPDSYLSATNGSIFVARRMVPGKVTNRSGYRSRITDQFI